MPKSVDSAFAYFMKNKVNLDSEKVKVARASRDFLRGRIKNFDNFFPLHSAKNISYGSFARRTKIRELDDIDMIFTLKADFCTWTEGYDGTVYMHIPENSEKYKYYCHPDSTSLNSRKILGKFISSLKGVYHYENANIHRNLNAVTFKLNSYSWNFDVVPAFITTEDSSGRSYYIIPDGQGNWMKTDPRIDQRRVSHINSINNGFVLNLIRAIKYWQRRQTMPSMSSYLLENFVLTFAENNEIYQFLDRNISGFLYFLSTNIYSDLYDPKGIQGNLNELSYEQKSRISAKALADYHIAEKAFNLEVVHNDQIGAIREWQKIFGSQFPSYG